MIHKSEFLGAVAAATVIGSVGASAATVDFTDKDNFASGAFSTTDGGGIDTASGSQGDLGFTLSTNDGELTFNEPFDGTADGIPGPLAGDGDGIGILDGGASDEISETVDKAEQVALSFDQSVTLSAAYFLDLFNAADGSNQEIVEVTAGGVTTQIFPDQDFGAQRSGFKEGALPSIELSAGDEVIFTPSAEGQNDNVGVADVALAGVEIQDVAPIPVPAGGVLLLTALGGLGLTRRRKG